MSRENRSEKDFVRAIRQVLDEDAANLDGATRSRLNRIRQAALETVRPRKRVHLRGGVGWLVGAAAAAVLAAAIYFGTGPAGVDLAAEADGEEFDIIALEDGLEFIDDIEFYAWLAEVDDGSV